MALFKPKWRVWRDDGGNRVKANTPGAKPVTIESDVWYTRYKDAAGKWVKQRLTQPNSDVGVTDKQQAIRREAAIISGVAEEREAGGAWVRQAKRPLAEHVADFRKHLQAKGDTPKHVKQHVGRVERLVDGCGFTYWRDVTPSRVHDWLKLQRDRGTFQAATSNNYIQAVVQFGDWMVRDRRAKDNPLAHIEMVNTVDDETYDRRALTFEEFRVLVSATEKSTAVYRRLTGLDRAALYLLAFYTGFRAGELESIMPESFDLDGHPPTLTVQRAYSKGRRSSKSQQRKRSDDVQPLRADMAEYIRRWLATDPQARTRRPPPKRGNPSARSQAARDKYDRLLLASSWKNRAAKMLRDDMAEARQAWINDADTDAERQRREASDFLCHIDAAGEVLDFHGMRHSYITNLDRAGASPTETQRLARHGSLTMTQRYTHVALFDVLGALDKLPGIPTGDDDTGQQQPQLATGTDGRIARVDTPPPPAADHPRVLSCARQTAADSGRFERQSGKMGKAAATPQETTQAAKPQGFNAAESREARAGFEPAVADLQSAGLATCLPRRNGLKCVLGRVGESGQTVNRNGPLTV